MKPLSVILIAHNEGQAISYVYDRRWQRLIRA